MAHKYPTVKATAAKHGGGGLNPFAGKKVKDFLGPGGFVDANGKYTLQLPALNKAQAARLLVSKVLPLVLPTLKEVAAPYFQANEPMPRKYWVYTPCPSCPEPYNYIGSTTTSCCGAFAQTALHSTMFKPGSGGIESRGINRAYWVEKWVLNPNQLLHKRVGTFQRKTGAPTPTPELLPEAQPFVPTTKPVPVALPMAQPQPQPKAQPWAKADVGAEPSTKEKPRPTPYPLVPLPVPAVQIDNLGQVKGQLDTVPVTQTWAGTGGGSVTVLPGPIANRQPGPKKKQQKINVVAVGGRVWVLLNMATEAIDFVDAMWKAIPEDQRRKCTTPQCKLRDLWDNMGAIDLSDAVENYLNMQLTDYLSALTGIPTKKLSQQLGHITGVDRAINQAAGLWMDSGLKDLGIETHNISELFPKIDWDVNSGIVNLSIPAVGEVDIDLSDISWSIPTTRR